MLGKQREVDGGIDIVKSEHLENASIEATFRDQNAVKL